MPDKQTFLVPRKIGIPTRALFVLAAVLMSGAGLRRTPRENVWQPFS